LLGEWCRVIVLRRKKKLALLGPLAPLIEKSLASDPGVVHCTSLLEGKQSI